MIVRTKLDLSRIARTLGPTVLALLVYDVAITAIWTTGWHRIAINDLPLPLLGSAIAVIVTFRNNAAYSRWWEARTLWGSVVNNSRSFARGVHTFVDDPALRRRLVRMQVAYAAGLRCALLGRPADDTVRANLPAELQEAVLACANLPFAIQGAISAALAGERRAGRLDPIALASLNDCLSDLANAQGGLERIKRTPLPRQYIHFPQIFVALYCLLLPLGLVQDLGLLTPAGSSVVGIMFLALDRIGRDLEDPFEGTVHDVPMLAITRTIEIDLKQAIGHDPVPEKVTERDGVLW